MISKGVFLHPHISPPIIITEPALSRTFFLTSPTIVVLGAAPPPKNVERVILEYVDCKKGTIFLGNNLIIAKFP